MFFLNDIVVIIGLSTVVLYLCHRIKLPAIVGYLLTGLLTGPYGFKLVGNLEAVMMLAEIGVVALLFTIGLEFSFRNLVQLRRTALLGGTLQVLLTLLVAAAISHGLGRPPGQAIFIGFLTALSSTAIVMKLLQERAEVETPHGGSALGILIYQDLIVVPMMLLLPFLAGGVEGSADDLLILLGKEIGVILALVVAAKWVVPWTLFTVTRTGSRELFLLTIVLIGLAVAWLTHVAGLSLAVGAFLAGLVISESEYSHQAMGNIVPFRDIFASFFFVSVGMLLDLRFLAEHPVYISFLAAGIMLLKSLAAGAAVLFVGLPIRVAALAGLTLGQIGEFSFILAEAGRKYGLLSQELNQEFLAYSVLTMMASPFLFRFAHPAAEFVGRLPLPRRLKRGSLPTVGGKRVHEKDHLIIVGFGIYGQNIARAAREAKIPYAVLDMNADLVREFRHKDEPIHYGDATHEAILKHVNIRQARILVVVISDAAATRRITDLARSLNDRLYIVARTRFIQEIGPLMDLGANEVVSEEFETSVEIFSRILSRYLLPEEEIHRFVEDIRADGYAMFRNLSKHATSCPHLGACLPDMDLRSVRVHEESALAGKTIAGAELGKTFGVTVLAVRREGDIISIPPADLALEPEDILFIVGPPAKIADLEALLRGPVGKSFRSKRKRVEGESENA
ncbi:MAG: Inner membrane protein YbaL [Syntrophaceae bacterium PtaB.Bin038]|nr:MAG: Inner membrane protein YbaL [Syntrophaceae bacterium PtaB.Bin038]